MPSPISFSYDAASRVVSEALNGEWSVSYGYDKAGNRTSVNDGTISRTMGYGTGNRETSVSDDIDPLGYDYKGNVVSRMTLDGTKTFNYGWDAYDRLISAVQNPASPTANVYYDYDTMGRLLRRTKPTGSGIGDVRPIVFSGIGDGYRGRATDCFFLRIFGIMIKADSWLAWRALSCPGFRAA